MQTEHTTRVYGLTQRQCQCLWVVQELTVGGVAPSLDEIAREMEIVAKSNVQRLLVALRKRGHVEWLPQQARSLRVVKAIPRRKTRA